MRIFPLNEEMCCVKIRTLFIIFGVFYYSEGKACPEKTRPHNTRCELYYKCVELPTQKHVWIPEKCEKGLVYVHNLKICALPGDDWECVLGEQIQHNSNDKKDTQQPLKKSANRDSDIYIVSNGDQESNFIERYEDGKVEVILQSNIENDENDETNDRDEGTDLYESSGDGIDFTDGFLQVASKEAIDNNLQPDEPNIKTTTTKVDPSLTAHLQRLSQLIDGLKKKYQNRDKEQADLTPDQLNAFLAHFNIKNKFDTLGVAHESYEQTGTGTAMPTMFNNASSNDDVLSAKYPVNRTQPFQDHNHKLQPETKVVLTNSIPKRYNSLGYSNSQIVVNRPEGSVLFSLPPYSGESHFMEHTAMDFERNSPKISEETLKTVLELSKQMIATQNVPKVIPNPAYYAQPIIQPVFLQPSSYAPSSSSSMNSPFFAYNNNYGEHSSDYNRPTNDKYHHQNNKPHYGGHKKPERPSQSSYNNGKPGTTIIHNNVIPVHVSSTNSGEKEIIDSYGQSLGLYPPLRTGSNGNNNNNNNGYTFQVSHQYENNKFVTTVRPYDHSTISTNQYASGQFPSLYDSAVTTVRPPLEYQPTPSTVAQYYTPRPHLSENNVNSLFKPPNRYPTLQYENVPRPMQNAYQQLERPLQHNNQGTNKYTLFPGQIDPNKVSIYPNSEKVESMETEDQTLTFNGYDSGSLQSTSKPQYNDQQSTDNRPSPLSGYSTSNTNKNPYLPRPQQSSYGSTFNHASNKPKYPSYGDGAQLVNIGGNFISYDVFQKTILPLIGQSTGYPTNNDLGNIEVISCQAGVRQPNVTDCTRYYVCSKKDGKVLSYSCPPYTAFNGQTRICDARTYASCAPDAIVSSYTVSENKRIQLEAIQALNEANRRRAEVLKAQNLANLFNQYNAQLNTQQPLYTGQSNFNNVDNDDKHVLNSYMQQAAAMSASVSNPTSTTAKPQKKRKYYCKEGDKVPDQTSIYNYFVCYKNAQGVMKGHKMTCSKNLLFCPMTTMCTLPKKCA